MPWLLMHCIPFPQGVFAIDEVERRNAIASSFESLRFSNREPMAASLNSDSKRYLYWWDSHISTKNAKWLQDNLSDMDTKVKAMKKLINEDADSFARRAEMYYKKRPELMNLVEEFYKAYRALAERYNHATGALRQAHRSIYEAFPNQIPALPDDSPLSSSGHETGPHTPEMLPPVRAPLDPDDLQNDAIGASPSPFANRRIDTDPEDSEFLSGRKGIRRISDPFSSSEGIFEGKARKGLSFEGDGIGESSGEMMRLREEVSRLLTESKDLKNQLATESEKANKAEGETCSLKEAVVNLQSEKDKILAQYEQSMERISEIESQFILAKDDVKKLSDELASEVEKLKSAEEHSQAVQQKLEKLGAEVLVCNQEIQKKSEEAEGLQIALQEECLRCMRAEEAVLALEQKYAEASGEVNRLSQVIESTNENLNEATQARLSLETTIGELKEEVNRLKEQNSSYELSTKDLQDEINLLNDAKDKLESEIQEHGTFTSQLNSEKDAALQQSCLYMEEILKLQEEIKSAKYELDKNEETMKNLKQELIQQNEEMQNAKSNFGAEIKILQKEIAQLNLEKDATFGQLQQSSKLASDLESQLSIANSEVIKLEEQRAHLEQALGQKCKEAEEANSRLNSEISALSDNILKLNMEKEAMLLQYEQLSEREVEQGAQLSSSQQEVIKLEEKVCSLEGAYKQKSEEAAETKKQLEKEIQSLEYEKEKALHLCGDLSGSLSSLGSLLFDMEGKEQFLERRVGQVSDKMEKAVEQLGHKFCSFHSDAAELISTTQSELVEVEQKIYMLIKELKDKARDVDKLHIELKVERKQRIQGETSLRSMENLQHETQQEVNRLVQEIEELNLMLKDLDDKKSKLETAAYESEKKLSILSEERVSSERTIEDLHLELNSLKGMKEKLENEVLSHLDEKGTLQRDLTRHIEEKEHLELRHRDLTDKMELAIGNVEALQIYVEELQRMNSELKDTSAADDMERVVLLEKVKDMEQLTAKHAALKILLVEANTELGSSVAKIAALEDLECSLRSEVSMQVFERIALAVQAEALGQTIRELLDDNSILKAEIEESRMRIDNSEALCHSHQDRISALEAENCSLLSQIESANVGMKSLEERHIVLQGNYSSISQERDLVHTQVRELHGQLSVKDQQHGDAVQSYELQLSNLDGQIRFMREENQFIDKRLTDEQLKNLTALVSNLILEESLSEAWSANAVLCHQCRSYSEKFRNAEKQISLLVQEAANREREKECIRKQREDLREGICEVMNVLGMKKTIDNEVDSAVILHELKSLLNSNEDYENSNVRLRTELAVLTMILLEISVELKDAKVRCGSLEQQAETYSHSVLALENRNHELSSSNEKLAVELQDHIQCKEVMQTEKQELGVELERLNDAFKSSEARVVALMQKHESLSSEYQSVLLKYSSLEEEDSAAVADLLMLDLMLKFLRSIVDGKDSQLKSASDELLSVTSLKNELEVQVGSLNGKVGVLEAEKEQLENSLGCLEEKLSCSLVLSVLDSHICRDAVDEKESELREKTAEVMRATMEVDALKEQCTQQCGTLETLQMTVESGKAIEDGLGKKIIALAEEMTAKDDEVASLSEANEKLQGEVDRLQKSVEHLAQIESQLTSELQEARDEALQYETEMVSLICDTITSAVGTAVYEEKLQDLTAEGHGVELRGTIQQELLVAEISRRNAYIEELHGRISDTEKEREALKSDASLYPSLVSSLSDHVLRLEAGTSSLSKDHEDTIGDGSDLHQSSPASSTASALRSLVARVEAVAAKVMLEAKNVETAESSAKTRSVDLGSDEYRLRESVRKKGKEQQLHDARHGLMVKDIELDQISSCSPYGSSGAHPYAAACGGGNAELDDEMLQLWEAAETGCKNGKRSSAEHDIQAVVEVRSEHPSCELTKEKDLESEQEWSRKVREKLAADTRRLAMMRSSIEDLKQKIGSSKSPPQPEYSSVAAQLHKTEEAVAEQIEINSKLTKKAHVAAQEEGTAAADRRRILEHAQRGSEKIGMLEFELQKLQYILPKLDEEMKYRKGKGSAAGDRRSRVLLRDYIYGRKDSRGLRKRKRVPFCICARPKDSGSE